MFVDEVEVQMRAGSGGNGVSTFRREKYVPRGGPSGGDGGRGGSVILQATSGLTTLLDYRFRHLFKAESGHHGQSSNKHGRDAPDLVLQVPIGTLARDSNSGEILGDLVEEGQQVVAVRGGRGGRGNARFASPTNQAPRFAENGEPGEQRTVKLELKLLADIGLVGLPNAGKSSLLNRVSAAHPKIADYPFTTLIPILGVVSLGDLDSCVMADIPGLIEGAHEGLGLGHQFLKHIERTRLLVHVLDASGDGAEDPLQNFRVVTHELSSHNPELLDLPMIVALNKIDVVDDTRVEQIQRQLEKLDVNVVPISAATGENIDKLLYRIRQRLPPLKAPSKRKPGSEERVLIEAEPGRRASRRWSVEQDPDLVWRVSGEGIERLVAMTNVDNESALERLHRTLEKSGILAALKSGGVEDGDRVRIRTVEFVFVDEDRAYAPRHRRRAKRDDE